MLTLSLLVIQVVIIHNEAIIHLAAWIMKSRYDRWVEVGRLKLIYVYI